uniref:Apple domain-containing protein n=1 Tax=Meloidogyne javanica TaxID=6303 RepID=A0A915MA63_MELJA
MPLYLMAEFVNRANARCFQKLERHSIDNSQPLTEIFRTHPLDCLSQCVAHTGNGDEQKNPGLCRSVVYDHLQHSCRLYSHDGKDVPAILHPANGFDLYRRTASTQECAGPLQRLRASLQAKKKVLAAPSLPKESDEPPILEPTTQLTTQPVQEEEKALEEHELASLLDQLDVSGYVSNELDCIAKGKPTGFFVFPAGQREDERVEEFPGWSQRECANFCAENEGPDGLKYNCAGFSHVLGGGKCYLHREASDIEMKLQQVDGGLYAEKWCIPAHRFGACREATPFDVRLQQRFQPRCIPIGVFDAIQNLSECMGLCLNQSECHTISYHTPTGQCLLHREYLLPIYMEQTDVDWTLAANGCVEKKGYQVPVVDNEEGEMEQKTKNYKTKNENNKVLEGLRGEEKVQRIDRLGSAPSLRGA